MDPVTAALLIKTAASLTEMAIRTYRSAGEGQTAAELEAILRRSDTVAAQIIARADEELAKLDSE